MLRAIIQAIQIGERHHDLNQEYVEETHKMMTAYKKAVKHYETVCKVSSDGIVHEDARLSLLHSQEALMHHLEQARAKGIVASENQYMWNEDDFNG